MWSQHQRTHFSPRLITTCPGSYNNSCEVRLFFFFLTAVYGRNLCRLDKQEFSKISDIPPLHPQWFWPCRVVFMSKVPSWTYQFQNMTLPGTSYLSSLHGKSLSTVLGTQYILNKTQTSFSLNINLTMIQRPQSFWSPSLNLLTFPASPPHHPNTTFI